MYMRVDTVVHEIFDIQPRSQRFPPDDKAKREPFLKVACDNNLTKCR